MARLTSAQRTGLTLLVASLGYFVDVFDLQLFSMVRVSSLQSFGLSSDEITSIGALLINWQMAGFLVGGVLWGILGDKKGRIFVLFGTILLYSVGNIANAFVTTVPAYAGARFFTGLGLAGEVGAGVTLLSELLPKEKRGYATTIMIGSGVLGPVVASMVVDMVDWHLAYICGGVLGLLLLALRIAVNESGMFHVMTKQKISRGKFIMLFNKPRRLARYLCCIGIAVPTWFVAGAMLVFTPEIGRSLGTDIPLKTSHAVMTYTVGLALGCIISGLLVQIIASHRKVIGMFLLLLTIADGLILTSYGVTSSGYYALMCFAGFGIGYWAVFLSTTAEQFGTNLRATATTSVANFVRGTLIIDTLLIGYLRNSIGFLNGMLVVGALGLVIAAFCLWKLPETFGNDLDFVER